MTESDKPLFPFEASDQQLKDHLDSYVDTTFASLSSFYLELPRGEGFLEYEGFKEAYGQLFAATGGFTALEPNVVVDCVRVHPLAFTVLRCILGISPPDLADLASERTDVKVSQGTARSLDQKARRGEKVYSNKAKSVTNARVTAMIEAACLSIKQYPGKMSTPLLIHRFEKIDTRNGLQSLQTVASQGVDYSVLLYERMLGRPFASHRDGVSELVGNIVEAAVSGVLSKAKIPFHKTGRAEKFADLDQAPDFLIPDKINPQVVIEAKLTQDDGTARDKVTRVQHLHTLSEGGKRFEVIACIDGRGFRIRREDMRKLIKATNGKVFSVGTIEHLIEKTSLRQFAV